LPCTRRILALDFDGVVCASSEESSYSAIIAAKQAWQSKFSNFNDNECKTLQQSIQYLRPIIETGYENMLIARYLYENNNIDLSLIFTHWTSHLRDELTTKYGISKVTDIMYYIWQLLIYDDFSTLVLQPSYNNIIYSYCYFCIHILSHFCS
jgi:hypothetical protein